MDVVESVEVILGCQFDVVALNVDVKEWQQML